MLTFETEEIKLFETILIKNSLFCTFGAGGGGGGGGGRGGGSGTGRGRGRGGYCRSELLNIT